MSGIRRFLPRAGGCCFIFGFTAPRRVCRRNEKRRNGEEERPPEERRTFPHSGGAELWTEVKRHHFLHLPSSWAKKMNEEEDEEAEKAPLSHWASSACWFEPIGEKKERR